MSFHCGHIIAEAKGGETIVSNLKPICQNCNSSMGTTNNYFILVLFNKIIELNIFNIDYSIQTKLIMNTCPPHVSRKAYYSMIWILQCLVVSIYYNYYLLSTLLFFLTITSIWFWRDCSNTTIRTIDITFATSTIIVKNYIAINNFTDLYKTIWIISLSICIISYYINCKFIDYCDNLGIANDNIHIISTYIHMFFMHFLITSVFSFCLILSK